MRPSCIHHVSILSIILFCLASGGIGAPTTQHPRTAATSADSLQPTDAITRYGNQYNSTELEKRLFHHGQHWTGAKVVPRGLPPIHPPHTDPHGPGGPPPPPPPPPLPPPPPPPRPARPAPQIPPGQRPPNLSPSPERPVPQPEEGFEDFNRAGPGLGTGLGDNVGDMSAIERSGKDGVRAYEDALRSRRVDTPVLSTTAEVDRYGPNEAFLDIRQNPAYTFANTEAKVKNFPELRNFGTQELGFNFKDPEKELKRVTISNKDVGLRDGAPAVVNQGVYDPEGQYILFESAFRKPNNELEPGSRKLPLNEMGMQAFLDVAGEKSRNFKAAFFMNIQNKAFWDITRQNYNDMHVKFDKILTFQKDSVQFDRYMGSPNINSKLKGWANHHNALGSRIPEKIIVIPKQVAGSQGQFVACLVFKDA